VLAPGYASLEFTPPTAGSYRLPPLWEAADGALLDAAGKEVALADLLEGRITVLSFIFTRCGDVNGCPLASYVLQGVAQRVARDAQLRELAQMVSVSFDPAYDTPRVVGEYGEAYAVDGAEWRFLTSRDEDVLQPVLDAYDQSVVKDYDADGNELGTLSHILRVYLIDGKRRIRNIYSVSFLHADTVTNDIRTLMLEARQSESLDVSG